MSNESRRPYDEQQAFADLEGQRAVHRALTEDLNPKSIWGVICFEHGKQGLSGMQYDVQMRRPDATWKCPVCGNEANWDDERYELAGHPHYGEKPNG